MRSPSAKPLLIVAIGRTLSALPLVCREGMVEVRRVPAFPTAGTLDPARPTVIVLDRILLTSIGEDAERVTDVSNLVALVGLGDADDTEPPPNFPVEFLTSYIPGGASPGTVLTQLRGAFRHAAALVAERNARHQEIQRHRELSELTRVGVALSTERDVLTLLDMILSQARRITGADAGSLYLVDRLEQGQPPRDLRFKLSQNHTLPNLPFSEFTVPIDHTSLAGYAAATGEPLVIADVYLLPNDVEYRQNRSFDEKLGYRTKSMLVIPMKTHRDEIIGVLQLINRKKSPDTRLSTPDIVDREVISFDDVAVELVSALASQAAVAIENSLLYEDIERLFEGFVTAAVTAIEARDPSTSGHSGRVATMTVGLAETVARAGEGPYRGLTFTREQMRELRYAGLLHDFGKVGVREQVLVKEKKLYPANLEVIKNRFEFLIQSAELEFERARNAYLLDHGHSGYRELIGDLESALMKRRIQLERYLRTVVAANEPTILPEDRVEELKQLSEAIYTDIYGEQRPLLTDDEMRLLSIRKGNLDEAERREIESHVAHTFRFLQQIPWTRELRNVPQIAYGHHEKLNGAGYPRAITADAIPVQTRMMTIADIFDALTAADRPYKRAMSTDQALDILHMEARDGQVDRHLLHAFVGGKIFTLATPGVRGP